MIAGRYELLELIGRGGSAAVHRGWDRRLARPVAVKVLIADPDESVQRRMRTEVAVLRSIDHPAMVTLLDTVTTPDTAYLVMELVEGGTLRDRIRADALSPTAVARIGACIADALEHIHGRGIVHRDVKPANILVPIEDAEAAGKLSDFGIAKLLELTTASSTGVIGTAQYLSPEQAAGRPVGPASDVYSLGLTLIEACTGSPAFPGATVESLAARLLRDPEVPQWLGYDWRSLLAAMTRRDDALRPTAADVAARLHRLAVADSATDRDDEPADTVPLLVAHAAQGSRLRRGAWTLRLTSTVAALVLATGAGAGMTLALTGGKAVDAQPPAAAVQRSTATTAPTGGAAPTRTAKPTGAAIAAAPDHAVRSETVSTRTTSGAPAGTAPTTRHAPAHVAKPPMPARPAPAHAAKPPKPKKAHPGKGPGPGGPGQGAKVHGPPGPAAGPGPKR